MSLIKQVREILKTRFELSTDNEIKYRLVDRPTLKKITEGNTDAELGAYKFEEATERTIARKTDLFGRKKREEIVGEKKTSSYTIFILSHLSREKAIEVCAHELAHDWMQEHCPQIGDDVIKEGWAEYVAWLVNRSYGNDRLNRRIEQNDDRIYGAGFRIIREIADEKGFRGLLEYLRTMRR